MHTVACFGLELGKQESQDNSVDNIHDKYNLNLDEEAVSSFYD